MKLLHSAYSVAYSILSIRTTLRSEATFDLNRHKKFIQWLLPQCCLALLSPCHLVLSTRRVLATVLPILLHRFLSAVTPLSSASFIPVTSCISSIHILLGRPLLLLPSPYASIILFSSPSDRITCPKNPSFLLSAVCCSVSSSSIPISMRTLSLVFFSVHDILCTSLPNVI